MIFSIPPRLSANSKIFVNIVTATSVIVVGTGNGDKGRQREVWQYSSPFFNC